MKKQTKERKAALTALLDALTKAADKLAPTPTAAGIDIDPDFRHISVKLPPQSLVDDALAETDGDTREELNRRAERLEREYTNFIAARRKWRKEVADPIRAMRGEMGELADPAGKLLTLRRSICDDICFLTGLLEPENKNFIGYQGGMSQAEFAKRIGKSISTIKRWEDGKGTPEVFDYQLGKKIKYSADLRNDRLSAMSFVLFYHRMRTDKEGIKNAVQYMGEETDKWNERKRLGYGGKDDT